MKIDSFGAGMEKYLLSNKWPLDDKFMTYSYAASDKTVMGIKFLRSKIDMVQFEF
jgi:hypothetical protein